MLLAVLSFLLILSFLLGYDIYTLDICTYLFLISLRNMPKDYYICKVSVSVCMPIEQLIGFCERTTTQWLLLLSSTINVTLNDILNATYCLFNYR